MKDGKTTHETTDHTQVEENDQTKKTTHEHTESGQPEVKTKETVIEPKEGASESEK